MTKQHIISTRQACWRSKLEISKRAVIDTVLHLYSDMSPKYRQAEIDSLIPQDLPEGVTPIRRV